MTATTQLLTTRLRGITLSIIATILFSSAYLVFTNETHELATSTCFFWFSCFACLASWICFHPKQTWRQSLRQRGHGWLATDIVLYCSSFSCLLIALKQQQSGVALTVIAISILRAPLTTMLGYVIAKDSCEHWSAYWIGTICVVLGLFLYRFDMFQEWNKSSVDLVTLLSIGSVILSSVDATVRKRYRNTFSIDQANAARSVFMGAIFISCVWMLGEVIFYGTSPCPRTAREWMAVIYLGVVPTAIANILFNKAEDTLSIPITQSIYCLSPFAALVVSMIPVPFFTMSHQHLSTKHYIGLVITVMGSIIVARFAGVKRRT